MAGGIMGGLFDGVELDENRKPPIEQPPAVLWTDEGLLFDDCYAANVIIPEQSTLH
jgi:hypothetical protein